MQLGRWIEQHTGRKLRHIAVGILIAGLWAAPASAALRSKLLVKHHAHGLTFAAMEIPQRELQTLLTPPHRLPMGSLAVTNTFTIAVNIYDKPGPSATLFANPYYTCTPSLNRYVNNNTGAGGSDSNDGTTATTSGGHGPWATLNHADSTAPAAGSCINVVASATAYSGLSFTHGGSSATSSGYVVYRCTTLNGCTLNDDQLNGDSIVYNPPSGSGSLSDPAYLMFDGFIMTGSDGNDQIGVDVENDNGTTAFASHHIWVTNNIITHFGQTGIQLNQSDYLYAIHNTVKNNSYTTCDGSEGSGISFAAERPIVSMFGYTETTDDLNGSQSKFGYAWTWGTSPSGTVYSHFHLVILWNYVQNNSTPNCTGNTDGNGIILDTLTAACNNGVDYNYPTLIGHNVVANNGSGGIHNFGASYTWMVNNSDYNDYTDPNATNTSRPLVDNHCATSTYPDSFYNNIVVAIAKAGTDAANHSMNIGQSSGGAAAAVGNITYPVPPTMPTSQGTAACNSIYDVVIFDSTNWSCTANKPQTNPLWVNVGNTAPGNYITAPNGANFALQATSPAIGFGTALSWMPATSKDSGACSSLIVAPATCP